MKVIVLTSEPISAEVLREAVGTDVADNAEILVVAPALHQTGLRFWMSDADEAIAKAQDVQVETVERLEEESVDAAGDTGESEPLLALHDALATFPADRIVIFSHPEGEQAFAEEDVDAARARFDVPVEYRIVTR
ncbi:MAG: hypothetical protein ACR2ML_13485 [Solirubrobacteraceae bacterium]